MWGAEGMEVRLGFFEKNTARGVQTRRGAILRKVLGLSCRCLEDKGGRRWRWDGNEEEKETVEGGVYFLLRLLKSDGLE